MGFQRVARVQDVPEGRGLCVQINGLEVGLFRAEGELHAMENRCPHAGDPLSDGLLEGPIITCPSHGWEFDVRTGFRPSDADGFPIPRFAVRVTEGDVEVDVEQVLNRPPRRRATPRHRSES